MNAIAGTTFRNLMLLPYLGDTTANEAILFSPPFLPPPFIPEPQYPNYTLPSANMSAPTAPSNTSSFQLLLGPTTSFPSYNVSSNSLDGGTPLTACALQSSVQGLIPASSMSEQLVLRDINGWRMQWIVQGLQPSMNYTAYVVQDGTALSGPINLVTKSGNVFLSHIHFSSAH